MGKRSEHPHAANWTGSPLDSAAWARIYGGGGVPVGGPRFDPVTGRRLLTVAELAALSQRRLGGAVWPF